MPVTGVAVIGVGALMAGAIGIVLYVGLRSAAENTEQLWVEQAETLVAAMQSSVDAQLSPVAEQARWIKRLIEAGDIDPAKQDELDDFIVGTLAATPQVAGIAFVRPDGHARRWGRDRPTALVDDWSDHADVAAWIEEGRQRKAPLWQAPIWSATAETTALLHGMPIFRGGEFLGMLGQIVSISNLSRSLAIEFTELGMTPFVLYDREYVLAHPLLATLAPSAADQSSPLPRADELGDIVLGRIWSPDEADPPFLRGLTQSKAVVALVGEVFYLFLYRTLTEYGPAPWTIGVYLNTDIHGEGEVRRLIRALVSGLLVLFIAVALAVYIGRKVSRPIQDIAAASHRVEANQLEEIPPLSSSWIRELDDAARSFNHMVLGLRERQLIRETLGRFVPEEVAGKLLDEGGHLAPQEAIATILFCDLEKFTALTERLGPNGIVEVLNSYFSAMVKILEKHEGVVTQFQGDAILATFNVPIANDAHAANAVTAALEMCSAVGSQTYGGERLNMRVGINTGRVVACAVGSQGRLGYTVHGDAVNLAARLESLNKELGTRILLSEHTANALSGFCLEAVGETTVRGQSKPVKLHSPKPAVGAQSDDSPVLP